MAFTPFIFSVVREMADNKKADDLVLYALALLEKERFKVTKVAVLK